MMDLKELIGYLEKKDRDIVVPMGLAYPHSYKGDYTCLAFKPTRYITVGVMLQCARDALGNVYKGWNGAEYSMGRGTEVYLAIEGHTGEKIGTVLLDYMTGVYEGKECESLRGIISRSTDEIAGLIADRDHVRTDLKSSDSKLFEYRVQIVEQSKAIHDLTVEKAQVGRAIEAMCSKISEQNKEINELGHRNENQMGSIQYQRKILKELTEEKAQVVQDIEAMTGTISEQNQTLLHIKAELDAAKQFNPFNLVLISGSMENISNVIDDHFASCPTTDEWDGGYVELKKKLDVKTEITKDATIKIQCNVIEDLGSQLTECLRKRNNLEKERDFEHNIADSYRGDIEDLKDSIRGLEAELASAARSLLDSSPMIFERDRIIENKVATINWLEARIDNQMKRLQSRSEEITSLKAKLVIRNVPAMEESLKSSARLALRQDDEITSLKAELAALNADLAVLIKVVNVIRDWDDRTGRAFPALYKIVDLLVDYTDIPEVEVIK